MLQQRPKGFEDFDTQPVDHWELFSVMNADSTAEKLYCIVNLKIKRHWGHFPKIKLNMTNTQQIKKTPPIDLQIVIKKKHHPPVCKQCQPC